MAKQKTHRSSYTTLLLVGEGRDDWAFITHVKNLFCPRGSGRSITIKAGDGGSPGNIITHAERAYRSQAYDQRCILLDSDIPLTSAEEKKAKAAGYRLLFWQPQSLEGALLDVLGEAVSPHESSKKLKERLHPRLAAHHTEPAAYVVLFPKIVLEQTANPTIVTLRNLM